MYEAMQVKVLAMVARLLQPEREEGQALVEYALIISLIAIVAIGALELTGTRVTGILTTIANAL
jgi:Flp pilus assembly pilin Flp